MGLLMPFVSQAQQWSLSTETPHWTLDWQLVYPIPDLLISVQALRNLSPWNSRDGE